MDPFKYTYPSPLMGFDNLPTLPDEKAEDGKSYVNPQTGVLSKAYEAFVDPIEDGVNAGFDIHIYFDQDSKTQTTFAHSLWSRIRYEFPELRIYQIWDKPIGPHLIGMFEVNVFTPAQFGAFVAWMVINRGPLSVLVHPNTGDAERDHTQRATWMGERLTLDMNVFERTREMRVMREKLEGVKADQDGQEIA